MPLGRIIRAGVAALALALPAGAGELFGVQWAGVDPLSVHESAYDTVAVGVGSQPFTGIQVALMQTTPDATRRTVYALVPVGRDGRSGASVQVLESLWEAGFDGILLDLTANPPPARVAALVAAARQAAARHGRDAGRVLALGPASLLQDPTLEPVIDGVVLEHLFYDPTGRALDPGSRRDVLDRAQALLAQGKAVFGVERLRNPVKIADAIQQARAAGLTGLYIGEAPDRLAPPVGQAPGRKEWFVASR